MQYLKQISLLLVIITVAGCVNQANESSESETAISGIDSVPKNYLDTVGELESQSTILNYDSLGQVISKIHFDVRTKNLADYTDGVIPWIRIDSPQVEIKNLIGRDDIVLSETKITIIIDYPLTSTYKFDLLSKNGFTRQQLIYEISNHYYQLYDEEEKTATVKTVPLKDRRIYNRNRTNGKYGIWGHDISDLVLDEIYVYKNARGVVTLTLQIDS